MTCKDCIHFVKLPEQRLSNGGVTRFRARGECRKHAPVQDFRWPRVRPDDYCSQYEEYDTRGLDL